jgi:hypothetical protein
MYILTFHHLDPVTKRRGWSTTCITLEVKIQVVLEYPTFDVYVLTQIKIRSLHHFRHKLLK